MVDTWVIGIGIRIFVKRRNRVMVQKPRGSNRQLRVRGEFCEIVAKIRSGGFSGEHWRIAKESESKKKIKTTFGWLECRKTHLMIEYWYSTEGKCMFFES